LEKEYSYFMQNTRNKKQKDVQGEILYGIHPIVELLKAKKRKLLALYTTKPIPQAFAQIEALMPKYPVQINYVSRETLARMAGTPDNQSVVALAAPFAYRSTFFSPDKSPFLLMLDGIQDVRNLGAILRSAYCVGIDGIIITQRKSAPLQAAALKASAGLAEHLPIYLASSSLAAAQQLKEAGYNLYITNFKGENAAKISYTYPLCLVIGSEGTGVNPAIFKFGTQVTIPQRSQDISYNASVAAGIMLFLVSHK
jgi:23S rRNA (guanosine2251-2'-O)-methyltransferase